MIQSTNNVLRNYLVDARTVLESPVFDLSTAEDVPWKSEFIQLITLMRNMLLVADQAGRRVDFWEGVGVHGKIQDITSLIDWMYTHLPDLAEDKPEQLADNHLNRYANQGWGYFANGCFFTAEFTNELAFFIDDQRLYLTHHVRRAIAEIEQTFNLQA